MPFAGGGGEKIFLIEREIGNLASGQQALEFLAARQEPNSGAVESLCNPSAIGRQVAYKGNVAAIRGQSAMLEYRAVLAFDNKMSITETNIPELPNKWAAVYLVVFDIDQGLLHRRGLANIDRLMGRTVNFRGM